MSEQANPQVIYVVGAGLSAGLGFPTIKNLLPQMWPRLEELGLSEDLEMVIRFHHPDFNSALVDSYPTIEELLSEMHANSELFDSSRPATGGFTSEKLETIRETLLLELGRWFHSLQREALSNRPGWLVDLAQAMIAENATVISFNWDLVLDELLFEDNLDRYGYGFGERGSGPRLIKPHGSLNWYEQRTGRHLKAEKRLSLTGSGKSEVYAFRPFREPTTSSQRTYMPLIVPPVFSKNFGRALFRQLWQRTVYDLSKARQVRFLGYSLPSADYHARFILRCGFHNQVSGELTKAGKRAFPTGRARVTIVDPVREGPQRIERAVGWRCEWRRNTIGSWIESGGLRA